MFLKQPKTLLDKRKEPLSKKITLVKYNIVEVMGGVPLPVGHKCSVRVCIEFLIRLCLG